MTLTSTRLFILTLLFFSSVSALANETVVSKCKFKDVDARVEIGANTELEKINGVYTKAIRSVLFINGRQIPALRETCSVSGVKTIKNKVSCVHQANRTYRYELYTQINQITGKAEKISMIVWQNSSPTVYSTTCK